MRQIRKAPLHEVTEVHAACSRHLHKLASLSVYAHGLIRRYIGVDVPKAVDVFLVEVVKAPEQIGIARRARAPGSGVTPWTIRRACDVRYMLDRSVKSKLPEDANSIGDERGKAEEAMA